LKSEAPDKYDADVVTAWTDLLQKSHPQREELGLASLTTKTTVTVPEGMPKSPAFVPGSASSSALTERRQHARFKIKCGGVVHTLTREGNEVREQLGVPQDHFVFYSIGVWDARKALADLVGVFSRAFCADDKVSLVLKTSAFIDPLALEREEGPEVVERVRALQDAVAAETGRAPARVAVIAADEIAARAVDALHATGDCFVTLTHGEGWGMGVFDAATLGKPVLLAPFGGPADYLPADYPGFIDYRMTPVSGWVESASFQPPQRWAQPDPVDAGRKMRTMVARYAEFLEPAALASERIVNRYAEPVIARALIDALGC